MEIKNIGVTAVKLGESIVILPGETLDVDPAKVDMDAAAIFAVKGHIESSDIPIPDPTATVEDLPKPKRTRKQTAHNKVAENHAE